MRVTGQNKAILRPGVARMLSLVVLATGGFVVASGQQILPENPPASPGFDHTDSHFTQEDLGDSMLIKRRYQEAIEAYKSAPGDSSAVWNKMGIAYQMLLDAKDAERCYKESLRLKPSNPWTLNNLGTVYASRGDYAEAEKLYRKGLKFDPNSARLAMNLGTILMLQNKFAEGSDMYKRAVALDPDVFNDSGTPVSTGRMRPEQRGAMNYYKARGCAQAGMIDCAIQFLERALSERFTSVKKIAQDSSFARLRGNPAFERLIDQESKP